VSPAFGKKATIELEVTPDKEWNGKMQYNYKLKKITPVESVGYKSAESSDIPESFSSSADQDVPF
jgi:hypothetical protein